MSDGKLVGIVLVSHSAEVAEAVAGLARGLAGGGPAVPLAPAGGTEGGGLGTSAELRDGQAIRVTDYWGEPFTPPGWRKALATRLDMPRDGVWPAADLLRGD